MAEWGRGGLVLSDWVLMLPFCFYMGCFRHKDVPLQRFKKIYYKKSYILMKRTVTGLLLAMAVAGTAQSETIERLKFGDMDEWVTRIVKESSILGGHTKMCMR